MRVVLLHHPRPVKTDRSRNVSLPEPDVILPLILIQRPRINQQLACLARMRLHRLDVRRNPRLPLLRQLPRRIAEVLLHRLQPSLHPLRKSAIHHPDVLHPGLLKHIHHHARAQHFVIRQRRSRRIHQMRPLPVNPRPHQQRLRQLLRQILHRHRLVSPSQGVEVDMVRRRQVTPEIILVPPARIQHHRSLRRIRILHHRLRFRHGNQPDPRTQHRRQQDQQQTTQFRFHNVIAVHTFGFPVRR